MGEIINTADTIIVKLNRRAYSPVLRSAGLPADTTVPPRPRRPLTTLGITPGCLG